MIREEIHSQSLMREKKMLSTFFYYFIYTSVILVYGIGINKATILSEKPSEIFVEGLKMFLSVVSSAVLTYLITVSLLHRLGLMELYPFVSVLIYIIISIFIETFVRITANRNASNFGVPVLCIILAVGESSTLTECVLISCYSILSFYILVPVLFAIRKRIEISHPAKNMENSSLLYISLAIILIILVAWNVSWLNPGVFNW